MRELFNNEDDDIDTMQQKQLRFYALVGICISDYQSIEDRLESIFKASLRIEADAAHGMFSIAKSLEDRCRMITAALMTRNINIQGLWDDLKKRIKLSADNRNQIAHASSVFVGRGIVIDTSAEGKFKLLGYKKPHSEMKLEKKTKSGVVQWDANMLRAERESLEELSRNITVLVRILVDGTLESRFADWWKHPLVEGAME
ncbi:hypothetical protein V6U71_17870 [Sphingopyxis sp. J-6]|uniref:hypothetical protein n=1 Tax=Sphingopyxis sp. J-6 TaxID=3122054 RepID=UPI0039842EEB